MHRWWPQLKSTLNRRWRILKMKFPAAESTRRPRATRESSDWSNIWPLHPSSPPQWSTSFARSACRRVNRRPDENDGIHGQLGSLMIQQRWGPPRWPLTGRYVDKVATQSAYACRGAKSVAIAIHDPTRNVHQRAASRGYTYHLHNCTSQIGLHACRHYPISYRHGSNRRRSEAVLLEANIRNDILPTADELEATQRMAKGGGWLGKSGFISWGKAKELTFSTIILEAFVREDRDMTRNQGCGAAKVERRIWR